MKKTSKALIFVIVLVALALLFATYLYDPYSKKTFEFWDMAGVKFLDAYEADGVTETPEFTELKNDGKHTVEYIGEHFVIVSGEDVKVQRIYIDAYTIKGYSEKDGKTSLVVKANFDRSDADWEIITALKATGVKQDSSNPNSGSIFSDLIMPLLTIGIGLFLIIIFLRQTQGGGASALDFGKTKAQVVKNIKVRFNDVAGAEEEKQELAEVVEFLKHPQKFTALGAKTPKGVLLVGNPGTGKTLFAKAVTGEANVPFFSISGSDFVEMFVGVGASRVRDLFNTAKKNMPCIIFIDEIDAVGRQRGAGLGGGNDEREQTLNQLLVQMDGFEANEGIVVIAATNRADVLDPALLRPGRFDRTIYVNMPDVKGREAILKVHARNKPLAPDVNFKTLARITSGFSGADLANLLNEAAILAARQDRKFITNVDLYEALDKVIIGPQKKSKVMTETDKRMTAYHESGHAILAELLPGCDPVHEVSIIPRGMAGGYTMTRPDNDDNYYFKSRLLDDIVMTMGGRAAEALICHEVTSGPSGDITSATKTARRMVTEWGMSEKLGPVCYGSQTEIFLGRDYQTKAEFSEETAKSIDEEVRIIVHNAYDKAVTTLSENKSILDTMARVLLERETIYTDEVKLIMQGKTAEEVFAYMDSQEGKTDNPFDRMTHSSILGGENEKAPTPSDFNEKNDGDEPTHPNFH